MNHHILTAKQIAAYAQFLRKEERAAATVEKYSRDILAFAAWLEERPVTKEAVTQWKERLMKDDFSPATVNAKLSAVNGLLSFLGREECKVKFVKVQKRAFRDASRDLNRSEYQRLLDAAQTLGRERLELLLETICATGIRVSEVKSAAPVRHHLLPGHERHCEAGRCLGAQFDRCHPYLSAVYRR